MNAQFFKRLQKLEQIRTDETVWLTLADGRKVTSASADKVMDACARAVYRHSLDAQQQVMVDLVKQSVDVREAGGGRMVEVYRAILLTPEEDDFYPEKRSPLPQTA